MLINSLFYWAVASVFTVTETSTAPIAYVHSPIIVGVAPDSIEWGIGQLFYHVNTGGFFYCHRSAESAIVATRAKRGLERNC
jgi:hypothetical protein